MILDSKVGLKKRKRMGNKSSSLSRGAKAGRVCGDGEIMLLHGNGGIEVLRGAAKARDVMERNPGFRVCNCEAFFIGRPPTAIPANDDLKTGHAYFVLPIHSFGQAITASKVATLISTVAAAGGNLNSAAAAASRPFKIHRKGDSLQVKISSSFISDVVASNRKGCRVAAGGGGGIIGTDQVGPTKRPWKPRLATISEATPLFVSCSSSVSVRSACVRMLTASFVH